MNSNGLKIYTPESSIRNPRILIGEMWKDFLQARQLGRRLAIRDTRAMYRQSIFGLMWAFIIPLTNTVTWIFLKNSGVIDVGNTEIPYPIYVFTGTMLWGIISESINSPLQVTLASKSMLSKVNFPREALILSAIYQSLFNSSIKLLIVIGGMLLLGYDFLHFHFLFFPFAVFGLILSGTVIGLLLTPLGLLYNDVGKGMPIAMQLLMYLTPVVFPLPKEGWVTIFVSYNPFTSLMMTARSWITGNPTAYLEPFVWVCTALIILFFLAWMIYRATMPVLIERMSS